jgi:hypothetical protein
MTTGHGGPLRLALGLFPLRLLRRRRFILARLVGNLQFIFILTDIPSVNLVVPIFPVIPFATLGEPIFILEFIVVVVAESLDIDVLVIHDDLVVVLVVFILVALDFLALLLGLLGIQRSLFARNVGFLLLPPCIPRLALGNVFGL